MANEQTSVPLFVADTILTAAQQNISAGTGVPVFATTVTRDAAFGGANKALAEGQLCYLSSTNVVQYYDGAAWASVGQAGGKVLQVVQATTLTQVSGTSTSYITSGNTATITPSLASSKVLVMSSVSFNANVTDGLNITIFRGTVAGTNLGPAIGMGLLYTTATNGLYANASLTILDSPNTTSAQTYTIGMKNQSGGGTIIANYGGAQGVVILLEIGA